MDDSSWWSRYLAALRLVGWTSEAARHCGIPGSWPRSLRLRDAQFRLLEDEALREARLHLEDELLERALREKSTAALIARLEHLRSRKEG